MTDPTHPHPTVAVTAVSSDEEQPTAEAVRLLRHRVAERLTAEVALDEQALVAEEVAAFSRERLTTGHPPLSTAAEQQLSAAVHTALAGLDGLQPLLEEEQAENIHIHGCDRVWVEYADGSLYRWPRAVADTDAELLQLLETVCAEHGQTAREFSPAQPIANLRLPSGGPLGARLAAVREVADRPHVAIRRHRLADTTLDDLRSRGTLDAALHAFLAAAVAAGANILVTGGPAAGKTTLLRSLAHEIDAAEHVVTVEDDYELGLHLDAQRHPLVTALEARTANAEGVGAIGLDALLKQALRHSPSRILLGEARGGEITALLRALGNGAAGGMGTLHATRAAAVPDRIAALGQLADPPLPIAAAHQWTATALDLIVHLTRHDTPTGRARVISEIAEVGPVGDAGTPDLTPVFTPDGASGRGVPTAPPSPELLDRLEQHGFDRSWFATPVDWWHSRLLDGGGGAL